jgi:hypothetical protein
MPAKGGLGACQKFTPAASSRRVIQIQAEFDIASNFDDTRSEISVNGQIFTTKVARLLDANKVSENAFIVTAVLHPEVSHGCATNGDHYAGEQSVLAYWKIIPPAIPGEKLSVKFLQFSRPISESLAESEIFIVTAHLNYVTIKCPAKFLVLREKAAERAFTIDSKHAKRLLVNKPISLKGDYYEVLVLLLIAFQAITSPSSANLINFNLISF